MKKTFLTAVLTLAVAGRLFADGTNAISSGDEKSRFSYALGMYIGHSWQQQGVDVDTEWFAKGVSDLTNSSGTLLTPQQVTDTLKSYAQDLGARQQKLREELSAKNKSDGEAFLATNKDNPGVVTLPDGLQYKVITDGGGAVPTAADTVTVNYSGKLLDGTEFDSSYKRGQPASFPVTGVIRGWTEALTQMKTGSKWQLFIPSDLAYGPSGRPGIPPNAVLIFEVELLSIQTSPAAAPVGPPMTSDIIRVQGTNVETLKPEDVQKLQSQSQKN
jgi:FKBP-type peptidyl-prolyl cis-trans isomerase FklB